MCVCVCVCVCVCLRARVEREGRGRFLLLECREHHVCKARSVTTYGFRRSRDPLRAGTLRVCTKPLTGPSWLRVSLYPPFRGYAAHDACTNVAVARCTKGTLFMPLANQAKWHVRVPSVCARKTDSDLAEGASEVSKVALWRVRFIRS